MKNIQPRKEENPVHIQIEMPVTLRKKILKTAIESTKLIQYAHEIKTLRQQEHSMLEKIRKTFNEIKTQNKELEKIMPQIERKETTYSAGEHLEVVKEDNELITLRRELELIENKLKEFE